MMIIYKKITLKVALLKNFSIISKLRKGFTDHLRRTYVLILRSRIKTVHFWETVILSSHHITNVIRYILKIQTNGK